MKKAIRIIVPVVLAAAIIACTAWYLFIYDRAFTRDVLLHAARYFESSGNRKASTMLYNYAYKQASDSDAVAIELAEQYKSSGNYTKAEYTLSNAIADGGGIDLYIALCKTYVEQDKLLDAVNMLNNVKNTDIKAQLDRLRPSAPTCSPDPSSSGAYYTKYITVTVTAESGALYVTNSGQFPSVAKDAYHDGIQLTDGENTIYAVAVAENGLVSPASVFGFTVGGVIEKVNFADSAVEAALREALDVAEDKILFTNDLWTIKEFSVPAGATTLEDLQHLAFLEKLTIDGSVSGQLKYISGLTSLKELTVTQTAVTAEEIPLIGHLPSLDKLTLEGCSLSTVSGLEFAKNLTYLNLHNNAVRNISALSQLQKLQEVDLSQNALNDLTALSGLTALTKLNVSFNNLSDLSPITAVAGLKELVAGNNNLTALTDFQNLAALTSLDLSYNSLTDISNLAACIELETLNISNNSVENISVVAGLKKVATFNFSNNKVSELPKFDKECELVNIDGSYNNLNTLSQLQGLKKLNNVFMDYNKNISSVKVLADCPMLIQVNVYGTKVTQVGALTSQSIVVNYNPTK